jgi:hypothetical protein
MGAAEDEVEMGRGVWIFALATLPHSIRFAFLFVKPRL